MIIHDGNELKHIQQLQSVTLWPLLGVGMFDMEGPQNLLLEVHERQESG